MVQSKLQIEELLAEEVSSALQEEIDLTGEASLLVSGGSTPKGFFESLSIKEIDWQKVKVSLVDERFLPDGCSEQNATMVQKHLLKNQAKKAIFYPVVLNPTDIKDCLKRYKDSIEDFGKPITVVVLGMGTDGHTASFFPDSKELNEAMSSSNGSRVMITHTSSSPFPRITFTFNELINAKHKFLHFYGKEKEAIYEEARMNEGFLPYPIQPFLKYSTKPIKVFKTF